MVDQAYEDEVRRCTERGERQYAQAQKRVLAAERRLERLKAQKVHNGTTRRIREATALLELRRAEWEALHAVMTAAPASSRHRGRDSFRPVPQRGLPL